MLITDVIEKKIPSKKEGFRIDYSTMTHIVEYNNKYYRSEAALCRVFGVNYAAFKSRRKTGCTIDEALFLPPRMSCSEHLITNILAKFNEKYYHNKTIKYIFTELNLLDKYDEFLDELVDTFNKNGFNWTRKRISMLRYDFAVIHNGKVYLLIEFDGEQHFKFVRFFFKTLENFLLRHNSDEVKDDVSEALKIPLLRIRYDQANHCEEMIEDALKNPSKYLIQHNTYLSNEEYWNIFDDNVCDETLAMA